MIGRLAMLAVLAALAVASGDAAAWELAGFDVERDLPQLGVWGPVAIVLLRFLAALSGFVPSSPVLLAAGATEGVLLGSIYILIGAELGALAAFMIGRHLGRGVVARKGWTDAVAGTRFGRWLLDEKTSQGRLMAAVFYCRLIPGINLDAASYVAGVTPITAWRFCLATFGALLPYTVLLVAIGRQLVELEPAEVLVVVLAILAVSAIPVLWRMLTARSIGS